jgi:hypothetical protein
MTLARKPWLEFGVSYVQPIDNKRLVSCVEGRRIVAALPPSAPGMALDRQEPKAFLFPPALRDPILASLDQPPPASEDRLSIRPGFMEYRCPRNTRRPQPGMRSLSHRIGPRGRPQQLCLRASCGPAAGLSDDSRPPEARIRERVPEAGARGDKGPFDRHVHRTSYITRIDMSHHWGQAKSDAVRARRISARGRKGLHIDPCGRRRIARAPACNAHSSEMSDEPPRLSPWTQTRRPVRAADRGGLSGSKAAVETSGAEARRRHRNRFMPRPSPVSSRGATGAGSPTRELGNGSDSRARVRKCDRTRDDALWQWGDPGGSPPEDYEEGRYRRVLAEILGLEEGTKGRAAGAVRCRACAPGQWRPTRPRR